MIYYFSGTGNSKWAARQLAKLTGDEALDIVSEAAPGITVGRGERVGLVFPIYSWGAPETVEKFAAGIKLDGEAYAYAVCTCGDDPGNAMEKLKKRFAWKAAWSLVMPNNYIPMFEVDSPAICESKLVMARERLDKIAGCINLRVRETDIVKTGIPLIKTAVVNPLFNAFAMSTLPFFADDVCNGCGLCERNCPAGAIKMKGAKPAWVKPRCFQCMACIHHCPQRAIQYTKATRTRGRYFLDDDGGAHF